MEFLYKFFILTGNIKKIWLFSMILVYSLFNIYSFFLNFYQTYRILCLKNLRTSNKFN